MANEEFDFNLCIKEVAEQMVKNPCYEYFLHVIAELIIRINDDGVAPMIMMNELHITLGFDPDIDADEVFAADESIGNRMSVLVTDDGCRWIPLYSSRDELNDVPETNVVKDIPIRTILEYAYDEEAVDGIIINPFTDSVALRKEAIKIVFDNADGSISHAC